MRREPALEPGEDCVRRKNEGDRSATRPTQHSFLDSEKSKTYPENVVLTWPGPKLHTRLGHQPIPHLQQLEQRHLSSTSPFSHPD